MGRLCGASCCTTVVLLLALAYFALAAYHFTQIFMPDLQPSLPYVPPAQRPRGSPSVDYFEPLYEPAQSLDLQLYVTASASPLPVTGGGSRTGARSFAKVAGPCVWNISHIAVNHTGEWQVTLPPRVFGSAGASSPSLNVSLWAHLFLLREHMSPDPADGARHDPLLVYLIRPITKQFPLVLNGTVRSLLGEASSSNRSDEAVAPTPTPMPSGKGGRRAAAAAAVANATKGEMHAHLATKLALRIVNDQNRYPWDKVPQDITHLLRYDRATYRYLPVLSADDSWLARDQYRELNASLKGQELTINITLAPITFGWWRFGLQMDQAFKILSSVTGDDDSEAAQLKQVFSDANPVLLVVTMVVSILHLGLDCLAFKNDIEFWRKRKSFVGISAHSLVLSFVCSLIIFLYLVDNEASKLVLMSNASSLLITFWKLVKVFRVEVVRSTWLPSLPSLRLGGSPAKETKTMEFDRKAIRYLSMAMLPLVIGYAIYSLIYYTHKSWYSWLLSSFASAMYVGGFIMMTPQLFINYKLQSVAHLPIRVFVYRAINTFIDDLFAFIIVMPTMHRLAVFRDDIVFLIYLYQRWIYPVDKSRGISLDDDGDVGTAAPSDAATAPTTGVADTATTADSPGATADSQPPPTMPIDSGHHPHTD